MAGTRLLYLGFAFPPGVAGRFPGLNPAGHVFECSLINALRERADITSVGVLPREVPLPLPPPDDSPGLPHALTLSEGDGGPFSILRAEARLRRWFCERRTAGVRFDVVLAYNLTPIYNRFIRWLRRQPDRPALVLLLADSSRLGRFAPWFRRLRRRLKPFRTPDETTLRWFDAAIGLSRDTRRFFEPRGVPWHWMPGGVEAAPLPIPADQEARAEAGPVDFAYFGALAEHAGVLPLVEAFVQSHVPGRLRICGHGKLAATLTELAEEHPQVVFDGLLPRPEDCLPWARKSDVLVNPRPATWGNENNFPSKIFQYAAAGRAVLTTRLSGVDAVLGAAATVIEPEPLIENLTGAIRQLAGLPRSTLRQRGVAIRARVLAEYAWPKQAEQLARFLAQVAAGGTAAKDRQPARGS